MQHPEEQPETETVIETGRERGRERGIEREIETERETEREKEIETEKKRETEIETERETERETGTKGGTKTKRRKNIRRGQDPDRGQRRRANTPFPVPTGEPAGPGKTPTKQCTQSKLSLVGWEILSICPGIQFKLCFHYKKYFVIQLNFLFTYFFSVYGFVMLTFPVQLEKLLYLTYNDQCKQSYLPKDFYG